MRRDGYAYGCERNDRDRESESEAERCCILAEAERVRRDVEKNCYALVRDYRWVQSFLWPTTTV